MCLLLLLVNRVWNSWIVSEATVSAVRYKKSFEINPILDLPHSQSL